MRSTGTSAGVLASFLIAIGLVAACTGGAGSAATADGGSGDPSASGSDPGSDDSETDGSDADGSSPDGSSSSGGAKSDAGGKSGGGTKSDAGSTSGGCPTNQATCPKGCADLANDIHNCGSCGYECPAGPAGTVPVCSATKCTFECTNPAQTYCPGVGRCVDLQSDADNCGTCGFDCQDQLPSVSSGAVKSLTCSTGKCVAQIDGAAFANCSVASCPVNCEELCQEQDHVPCAQAETLAGSNCNPAAQGCARYVYNDGFGQISHDYLGYDCNQAILLAEKDNGRTFNVENVFCMCHGAFSY